MFKPYTSIEKMARIFHTASSSDVKSFHDAFSEFHNSFMIQNKMHEDFFLAQVVAENGTSLVFKRENLNYSCSALHTLFSYYKKNKDESGVDGRCNGHKANQIAIGNKIYANRIGNQSVSSGDGYRFRGGGPFQLTGRGNYLSMSKVIQSAIGDALGPDLLEHGISTHRIGLLSAFAFWLDNEMYKCKNINCVTKKINRYTESYKKREEIYNSISSM